MSVNTVLAQILRRNSYDYDCLHQESILCGSAVAEGLYWRVPIIGGGVHSGFRFVKQDTKPTADSVRAIRVNDKENGIIYYVAIADGGTAELFTDACNACCDTVTPMATVALPAIIIEEIGCIDGDGNYSYFANVPAAPGAGNKYTLSGSVNGVALPAAPAEGFDDLAALETWADTNWSTGDLDGVTLVGGKVTLNAGPTGLTGMINVGVSSFFESNAPGALAGGEKYVTNATINGAVLPTVNGVADAALTTIDDLLNANASYAAYGVWSVVGGKLRVVSGSTVIASAAIVVTKV